ncbi:hypothetical protein QVD99_007029 [Batrachochytrium dendrobatidis]|nr:hypothetical protein QVD99_007029 [Batrachochytrium dendrobatidis]
MSQLPPEKIEEAVAEQKDKEAYPSLTGIRSARPSSRSRSGGGSNGAPLASNLVSRDQQKYVRPKQTNATEEIISSASIGHGGSDASARASSTQQPRVQNLKNDQVSTQPFPPPSPAPASARSVSGARKIIKFQRLTSRRWIMLRDKVFKGHFRRANNQTVSVIESQENFISVVAALWAKVVSHSSVQTQENVGTNVPTDSTTEFLTSWMEQPSHYQSLKSVMPTDRSLLDAKTKTQSSTIMGALEQPNIVPQLLNTDSKVIKHTDLSDSMNGKITRGNNLKSIANTSHLGRCVGLSGLSLDAVSNENIGKTLMLIAKGLSEVSKRDDPSLFVLQVHCNRGWKLILLGLAQSESFLRHIAMVALGRALPCIIKTLVDSVICFNIVSLLMNLVVSDERKENRLKAVYLIGQLGVQLGSVEEYLPLMHLALRELAKKLLEIQYNERKTGAIDRNALDLKIYLFHAIGKYVRLLHPQSNSTEDLVLYLVYQEHAFISNIFLNREQSVIKQDDPEMHVILATLGILNNELKHTEVNKKYIGALFKKFIHPLMQSPNPSLQRMAIQFVSSWLPILNEDAVLQGIECIQAGLVYSKCLNVINFNSDSYANEVAVFEKWKYTEQCRVSMQSKLLRELICSPGTVSKCLPVPGCPGFFCDANSSLLNTKSVLLDLPIHDKSNVTLTRLIPSIPGVPKGVTTIPPLFMDEEWTEALQPPRSQYEFLEQTGGIPTLVYGYTYAPNTLMDSSDPIQLISRREAMATPAMKNGNDSNRLTIVKNTSMWANFDDIPRGATRLPPKIEHITAEGDFAADSRRYPYGFSIVCPFSGYDPERIDRNAHPVSPIYGKQMLAVRGKLLAAQASLTNVSSSIAVLSSKDESIFDNSIGGSGLVEGGYTYSCNPILWPNRNPFLKTAPYISDFPLNAPVLLDIIQPNHPELQRILARVVGVDKDLSGVTVQQSANEIAALSIGVKFSIYIRMRENSKNWIAIQLEIIDDDYHDNLDFTESKELYDHSRNATTRGQSENHTGDSFNQDSLFTHDESLLKHKSISSSPPKTSEIVYFFPIPAGFTPQNEPYFSPPVNIPPIPAGYDSFGIPYYGRQSHVKPFPLGITIMGTRFYSGDGKLSEGGQRNMFAGIDVEGNPFFVPRGFSIPVPSGFTVDGIPYYDVVSLMRNRGVMLLPSAFQTVDAHPDDDEWENLLSKLYSNTFVVPPLQKRRTEMTFVTCLSASLQDSQPLLKHTLMQAHSRNIVSSRTYSMGKLGQQDKTDIVDQVDLQDPGNIWEFLRTGLEFCHFKPASMKIVIEPAQMEFQSVSVPITKTLALRYRANRGDHDERDYFLAIEPVDVFTLKSFHLRLQGEGVSEIIVTFNPNAMKSERVEGGVYLIDELGKRMASCQLLAIQKSFFTAHPEFLDFGWVLPEKRKETTFKLENLSAGSILVNLTVKSEIMQQTANFSLSLSKSCKPLATENMVKSVFTLSTTSLRLQPFETKPILVFFEPKLLGYQHDVVEVRGPGGDLLSVNVSGISGIPIALYPENEDRSCEGANTLARERTDLIAKFKKHESIKETSDIRFSEEESQIISKMISAQTDSETRHITHTLDFGICSTESKTLVRCLTFMNLGDTPATISLFSHHPNVSCPYLVLIAPNMANTIEITLSIGQGTSSIRGNLCTTIEVVCPEFQSIPLHVKAFIGQAVYFPVWENIFFKPCCIDQHQELSISLINESQYDLGVAIDGLGDSIHLEKNSITTSLSTRNAEPTLVPAFSLIPVTFTYHAKMRGPLMKAIAIRVVEPYRHLVAAAMFMRPMRLFGICIEPYVRRANDTRDKNGIEFLIKWMSSPKYLIEDYPTEIQRENLFDMNTTMDIFSEAKMKNFDGAAFDVVFKTDPYITEVQATGFESTAMGDSVFQSTVASEALTVQNRGTMPKNVQFLTSTGFVVDPIRRLLSPGDTFKLDSYFNTPSDIGRFVTIYGFATALDQESHSINSTQMIKRLANGILVLPLFGNDHQMVLDFGKIELTGEAMVETSKNLLLCNPHLTTYSWSIKFTALKSKFNPFDAPVMMGEVTGYETFTVAFKFKCDVSGFYETTCEVYIADISDKVSKPVKVGTIILRGVAVNTLLSGLPDALDFGSVVIFNAKKKQIVLYNNGTTDLSVTILVRPPFSVVPKTFTIISKSQMEFQVYFKPTETRSIQTKMQIFANQKAFIIPLTGLGGVADLVCEKYTNRKINFGELQEETIAWCSIYLTNKGTLPLVLKAVTSHTRERFKLQFVSQSVTVPMGNFSSLGFNGPDSIEIKKNYWSILKRKYYEFKRRQSLMPIASAIQAQHQLQMFSSGISKRRGDLLLRQKENVHLYDRSLSVQIVDPNSVSIIDSIVPNILELKPFHSYHFKMGYIATYRSHADEQLVFHYMPNIDKEETPDTPLHNLIKNTSLNITGSVYRPLELFPAFHDFGYAPAERYFETSVTNRSNTYETDSYGVMTDRSQQNSGVFYLEVMNMSSIPQNLILDSIPPEFSISQRSWFIQAGERLEITIEFHPPREQIQFHGDAVFHHKYGTCSVHLCGTGASAEMISDELVDFGSLKVNSKSQQSLRIHNRGLLETRYELDIVSSSSEFRFVNGDPYEHEGTIASGGTQTFQLECQCKNIEGSSAYILVKWWRVPNGILENLQIPLKVKVGYPSFRMQNIEIDFKTTFINVNKTLELRLYNEGNASCNWKAEVENPCLIMNVTEGTIGAGESIAVSITYIPTDFETLASAIRFFTDAGNPTLMCYGVVGVPYLKISAEFRDIDFGIITVDHTHTRSIAIANTGTQVIKYEIAMMPTSQDKTEKEESQFSCFYCDPVSSVVQPGQTFLINISICPRGYDVTYLSTFILRTLDGEQYTGRITAKGGKAIVKIKPPKIHIGETRTIIASDTTSAKADQPGPNHADVQSTPTPDIEASRYVFQSHLDNLYEVLAGLRTAELELLPDENIVAEAPSNIIQQPVIPTKKQTQKLLHSKKPFINSAGNVERPSTEGGSTPLSDPTNADMLDGSNLRLQSRSYVSDTTRSPITDSDSSSRVRTTSPAKHGSKPLTAAESNAAKFTDELIQMEKELEIAIGLRDPASSIISGSRSDTENNSANASIPGTADLDSKPGSSLKKSAGGLGKYQPGRRRGARREDNGSSEGSFGMNSAADGARGMTPMTFEEQFTPQENAIARTLSSRGLVPTDLNNTTRMALATIQSQKKKIENILQIAQEMTLATGTGLDSSGQIQLIESMSERILENTNSVVQAVQEQLAKDKWIPNRDFLQQALRRLQISAVAVENFKKTEQSEPLDENTFDLGLIRGGNKSDSILLFNIPNEGNIGFDYLITPRPNQLITPIKPDDATSVNAEVVDELFQVNPTSGTLLPGESVNISATFQASILGSYCQVFCVMSGDNEIMSFTVAARVGVPSIVAAPQKIDFGLVEKGKSVLQTIGISNIGSYQDFWRLEQQELVNVNDFSDAPNTPFKFSQMSGKIEAGETTTVQVDFFPREEGEFQSLSKIIWTGEPLFVALSGIGGGCRLAVSFEEQSDKTFGGFDFGICPVGQLFTKQAKITNTGTVTGVLEFSHRSKFVTLTVRRDDTGQVHLAPNESIFLTVNFVAGLSETIRDPIIISLGPSGNHQIQFKARCGIHDWRIDGQLDFMNVPILETQLRTLTIVNIGTLDLAFDLKLEPEKSKDAVSYILSGENWALGRPIRPNQSVQVEVKVVSDTYQAIASKIVITGKIKGEQVVLEFPFKFLVFVNEVALNDTSDVAVGRVMVGESVTASRNIFNFGNSRIRFRARVEGPNGETDGLAWKMKSVAEGYLETNETIAIETMFESTDGQRNDWQHAKLIIERCSNDGSENWSLLSEMKLVGATGHANLELIPPEIDFGSTGVGMDKILVVVFKNDGNAILNYEVQTPWESDQEITFSPDFNLKGSIGPGETIPVSVTFSPKYVTNYSSTINIKTPSNEYSFNIHGEGALYQIYSEGLPEVVDFGEINIAETRDIQLSIENGCAHDIDVSLTVSEENPLTVDSASKRAEYVTIHPSSFRIKGNEFDMDRSKVNIVARASINAPYTEDGFITPDFLRNLSGNQQFTYYLCIDVGKGQTSVVPIHVLFSIKPLLCLSRFLTTEEIDVDDYVSSIDFGPTSFDSGAKRKMILYNPNAFKMKYKLDISNKQYSVSPFSGILHPKAPKDILLDLRGLELLTMDTEVPKITQFNAVLTVNMFLDFLPPLEIPVTGALVDQAPVLDIPDSIDFGSIYQLKKFKIDLSISNPSRRSMKWRFYVERAFSDIFIVLGQSAGVALAKKSFNLSIVFCPAIAVLYKGTAIMESDAGNFTMDLFGTGVQPQIDIDQPLTDFGIVGINAPEFREVVVTNPLDLKLRIRVRSDNRHFVANISEFELKPLASRILRIHFSPTVQGRTELCGIAFFNLDDATDELEESDEDSASDSELEPLKIKTSQSHLKPTSLRKELNLLKEIKFEGTGGSFMMKADGVDVTTGASTDIHAIPGQLTIVFNKVNQRQKIRKSFEVENAGDTVLELGAVDINGRDLPSTYDTFSDGKLCTYRVLPATIAILPHGKDRIVIVVEGVEAGQDHFQFMLKTKTLLAPKSIKVQVNVNVLSSAAFESLRTFARADMNLDLLTNSTLQEEDRYAMDRDIWKLLLPIVRVSAYPASQEMQTVPAVEPIATRPDIGPYIVRPPAIPAALPSQTKKWYMNRVSMALEGFKTINENSNESIRRQEAIEFVQPLEKKMVFKSAW